LPRRLRHGCLAAITVEDASGVHSSDWVPLETVAKDGSDAEPAQCATGARTRA
jgi:hypothetical protein